MSLNPTERILLTLEAVCLFGPINLTDLAKNLEFSRAAIWRALDTLRARGWIKMRNGDNKFELTGVLKALTQDRERFSPNETSIQSFISNVRRFLPVHVDVVGFQNNLEFSVFDSSRTDGYSHEFSVIDDGACLAAQCNMPTSMVEKIVGGYLETCDASDREWITQGNHAAALCSLKEQMVYWEYDFTCFSFPIDLPDIAGASICVELTKFDQNSKRELKALCDLIFGQALGPNGIIVAEIDLTKWAKFGGETLFIPGDQKKLRETA